MTFLLFVRILILLLLLLLFLLLLLRLLVSVNGGRIVHGTAVTTRYEVRSICDAWKLVRVAERPVRIMRSESLPTD